MHEEAVGVRRPTHPPEAFRFRESPVGCAVIADRSFFPAVSLNQVSRRATVPMRTMSRTPEDIQDELLVLRCQEGDDDALRALITRWQPRFGRLAWRLTGNRESARDAVQETWLAIVRGLRRLDDPARFRSWAYRIAVNKCADWTRRRVALRSAASDLRDAAASAPRAVTGAADQEDDAAYIRDAMAKLPGEQRAILIRRNILPSHRRVDTSPCSCANEVRQPAFRHVSPRPVLSNQE